MDKSIQVFISVDDVPMGDLEVIQDRLEEVFKDYENKRIQITIQDDPLVRQPRR